MEHAPARPILVRELYLLPSRRPVSLELDTPVLKRPGAWTCAYRIRGLGPVRGGRSTGEDGLEAILHAVDALRRELAPFGARLTWTGEPGDLGLPASVPRFHGAEFARKVERMVQEETERETRRIQACVAPASGEPPTA
jgi:hypothetical protein